MSGNDPQPKRSAKRDERWLTLPRDPIPLAGDSVPKEADEFEVEFLEGVLDSDPCEESSLALLGHLYTQRGEYQKGLEVDLRLTRLRPSDPLAFYNLACSLSLTKRVDEAFAALERAVALGYDDAAQLLTDEDLINLRDDPRFADFCRRIKLRQLKPWKS